MREIRTSGSMSGEGKRSDLMTISCHRSSPRPSSTLPPGALNGWAKVLHQEAVPAAVGVAEDYATLWQSAIDYQAGVSSSVHCVSHCPSPHSPDGAAIYCAVVAIQIE